MIKPTKASSIEDYIAQIDEPRRSQIQSLHDLIRKTVPKLEPVMYGSMIGYGPYRTTYATGREVDCTVVALASQKQYISVYVACVEDGQYIAEQYKAQLPKASIGKSCIRFKKPEDVDMKVLMEIVKRGAKILAPQLKGKG